MPSGAMTLLDLKKMEFGEEIIRENIAISPELSIIPAKMIPEMNYPVSVRTGLPTVEFRDYNQGISASKASYEERLFQAKILNHRAEVDEALIDRNPRMRPTIFREHMDAVVQAAFVAIGRQTYDGVGIDGKGFPGLKSQYLADTDHEVDVTGTTALSSVWMLHLAPSTCSYLFCGGQTITFEERWNLETVVDSGTNKYRAYTNWMKGYVGFMLGNKHAAVRIKNIGTAANKTLTDAHLFDALEKFMSRYPLYPNALFMHPRTVEQLRKSRVATNAKGDPVPLPDEWQGIPIYRTTSISTAETN